MTTYKVSELEGALLDAAVEAALRSSGKDHRLERMGMRFAMQQFGVRPFSTEWVHGGPIIEKESISVETGYLARSVEWTAMVGDAFSGNWPSEKPKFTGPTPLIAAMRAYVASRFGETVELP